MKTTAFLLCLCLCLSDVAWALRGQAVHEVPKALADLKAGLEEGDSDKEPAGPGKPGAASETAKRGHAVRLLRWLQRAPAKRDKLDRRQYEFRERVENQLVQAFVSKGVLPPETKVFWVVHPLATKIARLIQPAQWDKLQEALLEQVVAEARAWQGEPFALGPTALRNAMTKLDPDKGRRLFRIRGISDDARRRVFSEAVGMKDPAAHIRRVQRESRRMEAGQLGGEAVPNPLLDRLARSPLPPRRLQELLGSLSDKYLSQLYQIASGEASSSSKAEEITQLLERSLAQPSLTLADQMGIDENPDAVLLFIHLLHLKQQPIGGRISAETLVLGMELPQVLLKMRRFARLMDPADQKEFSFIFQQVMIRTVYVVSTQELGTIRRLYVRLFSDTFPLGRIVGTCPGWVPRDLIPELKEAEKREGKYSLAAVEEEVARSFRAGTLRKPDSPPPLSEPLKKIYRLASSIRPRPRLLFYLPHPSSGWDDFQIELLKEMGEAFGWSSLLLKSPSGFSRAGSIQPTTAGLEEAGGLVQELEWVLSEVAVELTRRNINAALKTLDRLEEGLRQGVRLDSGQLERLAKGLAEANFKLAPRPKVPPGRVTGFLKEQWNRSHLSGFSRLLMHFWEVAIQVEGPIFHKTLRAQGVRLAGWLAEIQRMQRSRDPSLTWMEQLKRDGIVLIPPPSFSDFQEALRENSDARLGFTLFQLKEEAEEGALLISRSVPYIYYPPIFGRPDMAQVIGEAFASSLPRRLVRRPQEPSSTEERIALSLLRHLATTSFFLTQLPDGQLGMEIYAEQQERLEGDALVHSGLVDLGIVAPPSPEHPDTGPAAGLEERGALGLELLRYHRMDLGGVRPVAADDYARGEMHILRFPRGWNDLPGNPDRSSLGARQPLAILKEPDTGRRLALVKTDETARVVQDADAPLPVVSPGHYACAVCIARGWDPALKKRVILQWHFFPLPPPGAPALQPLREFLPRLLQGLQEIRILLSPQQDPRWKIEEDSSWTPAALRQEWNRQLSLPEGVAGILSVTIAPHSLEAGVTTIATEEAAGLFPHSYYETVLARLRAAEEAVTDPALFPVWPWDRMKDEILPVLRLSPSGAFRKEVPAPPAPSSGQVPAGLEEGDREALAEESSSGRPDASASDSNAGLEEPEKRPTPREISLNQEAGRLRRQGRRREALESLEEALRINPDNPVTLTAKAAVLLEGGEKGQALEPAARAAEIVRGRKLKTQRAAATFVVYARVLRANGKLSDAELEAREAVRLDPAVSSRITLAQVLRDAGKLSDAELEAREAVRLDTASAGARITLAQVLRDAGKLSDAEESLRRVIEAAPEDPLTHFVAGIEFLRMDKIPEAQESFGNAYRLKPEDARIEEYALRDWTTVAEYERKRLAEIESSRLLARAVQIEALPTPSVLVPSHPSVMVRGKVIPLQQTYGAFEIPGHLEGAALYLEASEAGSLRPGKVKKRAVAVLVNFKEYTQGIQGRQGSKKHLQRAEAFFPQNVQALRVIIFYNAPKDLQQAIDRLRPRAALFQGRPALAVAEPLHLPDESILTMRLDQQGQFVAIQFDSSNAGMEEGVGYVAVEGVGLLVPARLPVQRYYAVAVGPEQAAALVQAGRLPTRLIAVAARLEDVAGLAALGVPGDQIVRAWEWLRLEEAPPSGGTFLDRSFKEAAPRPSGQWPSLEAAKNYAIRLAREWLTALEGLRVSVLEVTARSPRGALAQLLEMLPSGWQRARPVTAEDAERLLDLSV